MTNTTGWPPGLLQDDSRELARWFSTRPDARRVVREVAHQIEEKRMTNTTDKAMREAVPLPEPTCDEVQFVFERWLEKERPSGDGEDVQRQWERSGAHDDLYETFSLQQLLSYGDAREAAALASSAPLSEPTAEGVTPDALLDLAEPLRPLLTKPEHWGMVLAYARSVIAAMSSPASSAGMDAQRLEEMRRALAAIGVVGQIDGHDVVRRLSVLDIAGRRIDDAIASKGQP